MAKPNATGVYAAAHFGLELDGKNEVSLFRSIEGGGVKADVMTYQHGAAHERWRVLGKPRFEDLKLQVGMSMTQPFYQWITEFFAGKGTRKNGAIVAADFYYKERARRLFRDALIKEVVFPKLDAQDKNPVYMNITLAIEEMEFLKGSGEKLAPQANGFDAQKQWSANNFSMTLEGYSDACRRVTKIDSFTIKQNIIEHNIGVSKVPIKMPSSMDFPNIVFYVPEADAQQFLDHFAKRVGFGIPNDKRRDERQGEVRDAATMNGRIDVYDNEMKVNFWLEFGGADIVSVTPDKSDATSEELKQVKIELYTEKMDFFWPVLSAE